MGRVPGSQGTWDLLHFEIWRPAPLLSLEFSSPRECEWGPMFQIELNRLSSRSGRVAAIQPKRITPTILIAEDSRDGREMLQVLLGLKGYSVVTAADGRRALEVALESLPDLILLDLELPGLDGLSVARDLRRHSNFRSVPIIVLSGHDPMEHKQSAIDAGCTDYLLKPLDFEKLDAILQNQVPL